MPPPHADNTAFVVVPSPAATASAMVTDELRVRLAVREGAASRAREAALSGEAVALAALDRRADGWRALAPAEIRALAAAAASMRERRHRTSTSTAVCHRNGAPWVQQVGGHGKLELLGAATSSSRRRAQWVVLL